METQVTKKDLNNLERELDNLYAKIGMDIEFTRHFLDRVNDNRNGKQITVGELSKIFKDTFRKHGGDLSRSEDDLQAVLNDISTKLNVPFVIKWNSRKKELELVAKTVMRKNNFKTSNRKLTVEEKKMGNKTYKDMKEGLDYGAGSDLRFGGQNDVHKLDMESIRKINKMIENLLPTLNHDDMSTLVNELHAKLGHMGLSFDKFVPEDGEGETHLPITVYNNEDYTREKVGALSLRVRWDADETDMFIEFAIVSGTGDTEEDIEGLGEDVDTLDEGMDDKTRKAVIRALVKKLSSAVDDIDKVAKEIEPLIKATKRAGVHDSIKSSGTYLDNKNKTIKGAIEGAARDLSEIADKLEEYHR
jgi:hypothetical protein